MAGQQPDFIRYYLQFPPVTRTFLSAVVFVSVSLQLGLVNRYSLYSKYWGYVLRFFDAGWGLWFLMTLVMCMYILYHQLILVYQQSSQVEAFFSTADYTWMLLMTGAVIMVNSFPFVLRLLFSFLYIFSLCAPVSASRLKFASIGHEFW